MNKISEQAVAIREKTTTPDLALIKRTVAPGATNDQLSMFLHDCERRGVHPLDKLIIFTNAGGKYTPITTIDFMRSRAAESNEMAGSDDAIFRMASPTKPDSATVTVYRLTNGAKYAYSATARLQEYYKNTPTWNKMPHTMLAKCAEALALRKAFPAQLHGLYTREEMDQATSDDEIQTASVDDLQSVEAKLTDAAEKGVRALREAWEELSHDEQLAMKSALDNRFKPRAIEVEAHKALEGGGVREETTTDAIAAVSSELEPLAAADPPHIIAQSVLQAYKHGQQAKADGHRRNAVPEEYREANRMREHIAWTAGWDGKTLPTFKELS